MSNNYRVSDPPFECERCGARGILGWDTLCTCPQEEITDCPKCGAFASNGFGQVCSCGEKVRENKGIPEGYEKELNESISRRNL